MSVDMETTVKTWDNIPVQHTRALGEFISQFQEEMMVHFGVIGDIGDIDDSNDNGFFPELDIEVHVHGDPDESTRRLVITNKPEEFQGKHKLKGD
tara:strand:- start:25 stop:309 length:285 start_codon:yes stop_codon:yes gene_type:complete